MKITFILLLLVLSAVTLVKTLEDGVTDHSVELAVGRVFTLLIAAIYGGLLISNRSGRLAWFLLCGVIVALLFHFLLWVMPGEDAWEAMYTVEVQCIREVA